MKGVHLVDERKARRGELQAASYKLQARVLSDPLLLLLEAPNLQLAAVFLFDLVEHEQRIIAELRLEL
ncbi:hypothetical protein PSCICJ_38380 [Pseudomonas cichorii]|nr:hypothetical protein PSCICJ_38380 [Pseudomonas cichorii]